MTSADLRQRTTATSTASSSQPTPSALSSSDSLASLSSHTSLEDSATLVGRERKKPPPGQDHDDFYWVTQEEPHRSRCKAIMAAHPEVRKLIGPVPWTSIPILLVVALQLCVAAALSNTHPLSWQFLLAAYAIGGTANQNLFLAIHEVTHNLVFRNRTANKVLAIVSNFPVGIPFAATFKGYHHEHHRYLGEDGMDTDLPSRLELICLKTAIGKVFFCIFQIFFYALRPGFVKPKAPTPFVLTNIAVQLVFDFFFVRAFGWYSFFYFIESSFFAGSLHPCAGHFIAEHYLFDGLGQETYSYYGPLNWLTWNVGYHNEHHDFPAVAWRNLPRVRALAPEFYENLGQHKSWPGVIYRFIFETDVGMFSRAKRSPPPHRAAWSGQPGEGASLDGANE